MEIGLVLTLCGLGIAFWIPAFILGMISGNKMRKFDYWEQVLGTYKVILRDTYKGRTNS